MRADELRAISLFDGLADDQLAELAGGGTEVRIEPGDLGGECLVALRQRLEGQFGRVFGAVAARLRPQAGRRGDECDRTERPEAGAQRVRGGHDQRVVWRNGPGTLRGPHLNPRG